MLPAHATSIRAEGGLECQRTCSRSMKLLLSQAGQAGGAGACLAPCLLAQQLIIPAATRQLHVRRT